MLLLNQNRKKKERNRKKTLTDETSNKSLKWKQLFLNIFERGTFSIKNPTQVVDDQACAVE